MNRNWPKILVFTLIGFALGFLVARVTSGQCGRHGKAGCDGENGCEHNKRIHKEIEIRTTDHPGDITAEAIVKDLEKIDFKGDTTIAIEGGKVHVVRTDDNLSVHVDIIGPDKEVKEIEIKKTN